jgi:hypothetical protein
MQQGHSYLSARQNATHPYHETQMSSPAHKLEFNVRMHIFRVTYFRENIYNTQAHYFFFLFLLSLQLSALSGRAVWGEGLCPLACWYCGFEFRRGHGCLCLVSVVWCQVEASGTNRSLVQRRPTDWNMYFVCDPKTSGMRLPWPVLGCCARKTILQLPQH